MGGSSVIWDIATGQVIKKVSGPSFGRRLFMKSGDRQVAQSFGTGAQVGVALRSVSDGKTFWSNRDYRTLFPASFSPSEKLLACVGSRQEGRAAPNNFLVLIDMATGKTLHEAPLPTVVSSVSFSPNGKQILVAGRDLWVYDANDLKPLVEAKQQYSTRCKATYSPDGRLIAVAGGDVRLYDARDLHLLATLIPFAKQGWAAYTPSGAANGSPDGIARLFKRSNSGLTPLTRPIHPEEIERALSAR